MDTRDTVSREIRSRLGARGELSCVAAHDVASALAVDPASIGTQVDEDEIRIVRCQLGLFGYAPEKGMPGYKQLKKLDNLPEPAATEVQNAAVGGQISCSDLWSIGREQGLNRLDMGNLVETLGFKVSSCQLGCFKKK